MNRRDFLKNIGINAVDVASVAGASSLNFMNQRQAELTEAFDDLKKQFKKSNTKLVGQVGELTQSVLTFNMKLANQQAQILILFFLLIASFAIDAGTTFLLLNSSL